MPTWEHDHRANSAVEEEHRQLYGAMARLQPIILAADDEARVSQATAALYDRLAHHFAVEEDIAAGFGPVSCGILKHEHRHIMALLAHLRGLAYGQHATRQRLFQEFVEALAKHDREVDIPTFCRSH